jgi:hypothetical protein
MARAQNVNLPAHFARWLARLVASLHFGNALWRRSCTDAVTSDHLRDRHRLPGVLRISQGTQLEIAQLCVLGDQASDIGRLLGSSERRLVHRVDRYRVRGGN